MRSSMMGRLLVVPILVAMMLIAGCDKGPSGLYTAEGPISASIDFKSGKAIFSMMGETKESDFTVNGDKVNIAKDPEGKPLSLTINSDGSLSGPGGMKFVKKK